MMSIAIIYYDDYYYGYRLVGCTARWEDVWLDPENVFYYYYYYQSFYSNKVMSRISIYFISVEYYSFSFWFDSNSWFKFELKKNNNNDNKIFQVVVFFSRYYFFLWKNIFNSTHMWYVLYFVLVVVIFFWNQQHQ